MEKVIKLNTQNRSLKRLAKLADEKGQGSDLKPHFITDETGVWFQAVGHDKDGTPFLKPLVRVCDAFKVIGRGQSADEREYRILEYRRNGRGAMKQVAFAMENVGRNDGLSLLRSMGISIKEKHKSELWDYIQWGGDSTEWEIVSRGGWTDKSCTAYVLPSGEVIGNPDKNIIYTGDTSKRESFEVSGSLKDWQEHVARYLAGNSRPLLALGTVFAAPFLGILRDENGGFHFYGSSSIGKSLLGMAAMSAMGEPAGLKVQWKGTSLGFDNEAAANNDGIVFLDEIGEAEQKTVKDVGYSVFNGVSKLQGAKQGGNRTRITWRILAISTGEFDAAHYLKQDGLEWNAGQAVRLPAIPADAGKGYGVFDTLHGFGTSAELALHLGTASKRFYGAAWRQYLTELAQRMNSEPEKLIGRIHALQAEFAAMLPPKLDSQPARAAKRFTLAAAALELAGEWGITGFAKGTGFAGVHACFQAWYERDGKSNREEAQIIKNAKDFLQVHGRGERFTRLIQSSYDVMPATGRNHAGFRIETAGNDAMPRFYINDSVFEQEICNGFDTKFVCDVLKNCGWLLREANNRQKFKLPPKMCDALRLPNSTRMYCLHGFAPPEKDEKAD
ncbi:DUF927 domain-containing protein [Conchiformibius steedae DSM 2580]|uniref:DUF927 domain-containing protein n=1 Tax=Conchiformibius steedae DSM 2580 TaxID=1121352 RepID=A0AAE9HV11_9NEIS|nr:DUF927 domain-containing protein [Conchiformibius steedae]QMT34129.1 DUF927 domain-containing protein [Conchiformibius steedae]URD66902.1 DUF927 domain-containing protein [Conchiformibius steedae DSM 2580]